MSAKISKRKSVRFTPDQGTLAEINFSSDKETYMGLVISEAHRGCSVVIAWGPVVCVKDRCKIKTGKLAPLKAEIRWVIQLDEGIQKIGFQYLE